MKLSTGIYWCFFAFYCALATSLFGRIIVEEKKEIYDVAANLFIESLLEAGVANQEHQNNIVKLHVEELTCLNPFLKNHVTMCAISAHGSTFIPSVEIAHMLMRVLRASGVTTTPAMVKNIQCLRPSFPFILGMCTYFIDKAR